MGEVLRIDDFLMLHQLHRGDAHVLRIRSRRVARCIRAGCVRSGCMGAGRIGSSRRRLARLRPRQKLLHLFTDHHAPFDRHEPHDQADLLRLAADRIPRDPHAVRVPQLRFAIVLLHLLGGEYVLAIGSGVGLGSARLVEGVDGQFAGDLDRLVFLVFVKHQPGAEAADRRLSGRVEHRVGPDRHDAHRPAELARLAHHRRQLVAKIEFRATGRQHEQHGGRDAECGKRGSDV